MVLWAKNSTIVRTINDAAVAVAIAPLDRAEAGHVVDTVFAGLSPRSRYLRFHSPIPRLPPVIRDGLVDVDGRRHVAVAAWVGRGGRAEPIGIARAVGNESSPGGGSTAELAVAVVDAWHRRGVGTRLLTAIGELAERRGHRELHGELLPENVAMQGLARKIAQKTAPWARMDYDGEVVQLTVPLGAAAWTLTNEDLMTDLSRR